MNTTSRLAILVWLTLGTTAVHAATITVMNNGDSGPGSLRDALVKAANGDTIDATGVSGTIVLTTGELVVSKSVTIVGPGPATLAVDGNAANRVLHIVNAVTVTVSSLTITNGRVKANVGGGLFNDHAALTVSNCALSGNSANGGGGIANQGRGRGSATLTVLASTLTGNSAINFGGGIFNDGEAGSAALTVSTSSISGNYAAGGGGIFNDGSRRGRATTTVVASTLSGNTAGRPGGGGIFNGGSGGSATLTVSASTFSGNSGELGGGICNDGWGGSARLEIGNTILNRGASGANIACRLGPSQWTTTCFGNIVTSRGYNLCSDDGGGFLVAKTDQINTFKPLGPLQNNGGPTFTHALPSDSPAINKGKRDAIPALAEGTDQRGFPRPMGIPAVAGGDGSDIGAFEVQESVPAPAGNE